MLVKPLTPYSKGQNQYPCRGTKPYFDRNTTLDKAVNQILN